MLISCNRKCFQQPKLKGASKTDLEFDGILVKYKFYTILWFTKIKTKKQKLQVIAKLQPENKEIDKNDKLYVHVFVYPKDVRGCIESEIWSNLIFNEFVDDCRRIREFSVIFVKTL